MKSILNEALFGKKLTVDYYGTAFPAILSKNTKPDEKPFRVSVFEIGPTYIHARGHMDFTEEEMNQFLQTKRLPYDIVRDYGNTMKILAIDKWPPTSEQYADVDKLRDELDTLNECMNIISKTLSHNELYLLEESSREIDLWTENRSVLITESMDLYVSGANYEKIDTLGRLSFQLMNPIARFLEKLPKDQLDYFEKNRMLEWLTPDGDDFFKPIGTLNLYTSGFTRQALIGSLKVLFDSLKKLGVSYGKVKTEPSRMYKSTVIRIPITHNPFVGKYQGPPELNLANMNAHNVFHNVLQYEWDNGCSMKADELLQRVATVLKHDPEWIDKNKRDRFDSQTDDQSQMPDDPVLKALAGDGGDNGPRIISGGQSAERITHILYKIAEIAQWAIKHGHKDLYVN